MIYEPHEPTASPGSATTPEPPQPAEPLLCWHLMDLAVVAGLGLALVHVIAAALDLLLTLW